MTKTMSHVTSHVRLTRGARASLRRRGKQRRRGRRRRGAAGPPHPGARCTPRAEFHGGASGAAHRARCSEERVGRRSGRPTPNAHPVVRALRQGGWSRPCTCSPSTPGTGLGGPPPSTSAPARPAHGSPSPSSARSATRTIRTTRMRSATPRTSPTTQTGWSSAPGSSPPTPTWCAPSLRATRRGGVWSGRMGT